MKNVIFVVISILFALTAIGQDNYSTNQTFINCDSVLSYSHPNKHYSYYRMGKKLIEYKLFVDKLKSYKDSAAEFKKAKKYEELNGVCLIGLGFSMIFVTPVLCSVFATPVFGLIPVGCIVCSIIYSKLENKHLQRSIKLYNLEVCNNRR